MPYGGPPKSGCVSRPVLPPVFAIHVALCELTGRFEMSVFQMLPAGKTEHVVPGTAAACTGFEPVSVTHDASTSRPATPNDRSLMPCAQRDQGTELA